MIFHRMTSIMYTVLEEPDVPEMTGRAFTFVKGKEVYKLKDIQRYCKTKILAQPIPSSQDVAMIKAEKIMERIGNIIEEEDLSKTINFIEQAINESDDLTAMDIAAAFLLDALGTQEGNVTGSSDYDFENTRYRGHGQTLYQYRKKTACKAG